MIGIGVGIGVNSYVAGGTIPLLLDTYSGAAAAYSLRKLRTAYTGNAIRIRRSNDNAETNIGFVGNDLDTAAITSFVGANSAFVTTWYDQSLNSLNVTQSAASDQPQIVNAGSLETLNNKPALRFVPNDYLNGGNILSVGSNPFISFVVAKSTGVTNQTFYSKTTNGGAVGRNALWNYGGKTELLTQTTTGNSHVTASKIYTDAQYLYNQQFLPNSFNKLFFNNVEDGSVASNTIGVSTFNFFIGLYPTVGLGLNGNMQEAIFYLSDQSANRSLIATNINTYYSIY